MSIKMIENNDLPPGQEFVPAQKANRVLMYVQQDDTGNLSFQPANLVYHDGMKSIHANVKEGDMLKPASSSFLKVIGLSLPIVVAVVASTVWISTTIESKARDNRLEMKADLIAMQQSNKADIEQARQDVLTQTYRLQDGIQRLSDRSDEKFDKISTQISMIQQNQTK